MTPRSIPRDGVLLVWLSTEAMLPSVLAMGVGFFVGK